MRTFIWADHNCPFSEYEFFVAHADNLEDARVFIKNQLKFDLEAQVNELHDEKEKSEYKNDSEYLKNFERWLDNRKEEYEQNVSSIDKYEPSHIVNAGMGMHIHHANE